MENDGYITIGTKIDTSSFDSQMASMKKGLERKMSSMENTITKTFGLIKTGIVGAGIALAVKAISNNLDGAIKRLDTLKNYTKVMSNLGISADDAQASMDRLSDALVGLPTTMDDAVASVQRFTSANSNVGASTEMFLALNNAILAGGANAQTQASALEQLSQAYAKGKPDMMEWRTAMSAMPAQLKQTAQAMGYVSADKLGEALRTGQVSMNEFMLTLVKLNKEGVAGFQSFEEQARNATGGIATSIQNVKTAITRGVAQILDAIGQANIASFFQGIAKAINKVIPYITAFIKLISTAVSYVASLFGKKVETTTNDVSANVSDTSEAVSNLNNNLQDTSQDMNDTSKSAKGLNKALSNLQKFDELNVLQAPSSSGSGAEDSANALANMDLSGMTLEIQEASDTTDGMLDNLTAKLKEIMDLFGEGFKLSFGEANFDNIIEHIGNIKERILDIGTDPRVVSSAKTWAETLMFSLGRVAGSIGRIGTNIAEYYVGAIDTYLEKNSGRIKTFVTRMFEISAEDVRLTADFVQTLGSLSDVFSSDTAKQTGANILSAIYNPLMSVYETLQSFALDIKKLFFQPIIDNADKLKLALENAFSVFEKITGTLSTAMADIGDTIKGLYQEHIQPFMDKITIAFSDTFGKFLDTYNEKIKPVMDKVAEKFDTVWKEHLKPALEKIGQYIGTVFDTLGFFWTTILKPVVDWIIQNVVPLITTIFGEGLKYLFEQLGNIGDILGGVMDMFKGVYEIVLGLFTLDFSKIGKGFKSIFGGISRIFEGLFNIIKSFLKMIGTSFSTMVGWIYDTFIKPIVDWFVDMWNNIITKSKEAISKVIGVFETLWDKVKNIFEPIANWINDNVVEPIKKFFKPLVEWFTNLFTNIKNFIQSAFDVIKGLAQGCVNTIVTIWQVVSGWFNEHVIEPVKEKFSGMWDGLKEGAGKAWEGIKEVFGKVGNFFKETFETAWEKVKNVFSKGGEVFVGIKEGISTTFKRIVNNLIDGINKVVKVPFGKINEALDKVRGFEVFGQKPFGGLPRISIPQIPKLAKGTILNAPGKGTLVAGGTAIAGEAGREAYLPLSDTQLLEELGSTIGKYITINANIVNQMNGRVLSREIKRIQNDENFAYNI